MITKNAEHFSTSRGTVSLEGYLDDPEKFSRTRNLLEVQERSLYYFPEFGVDKSILNGEQPISIVAMQSYIRQKALTNGIVLFNSGTYEADFEYNLNFIVETN